MSLAALVEHCLKTASTSGQPQMGTTVQKTEHGGFFQKPSQKASVTYSLPLDTVLTTPGVIMTYDPLVLTYYVRRAPL
jgi:hypothetical protein